MFKNPMFTFGILLCLAGCAGGHSNGGQPTGGKDQAQVEYRPTGVAFPVRLTLKAPDATLTKPFTCRETQLHQLATISPDFFGPRSPFEIDAVDGRIHNRATKEIWLHFSIALKGRSYTKRQTNEAPIQPGGDLSLLISYVDVPSAGLQSCHVTAVEGPYTPEPAGNGSFHPVSGECLSPAPGNQGTMQLRSCPPSPS